MIKNYILGVVIISLYCIINSYAQDRYLRFETQQVIIDELKADGYILAIGGGGEGTIGKLKGSQVIAIDISKRELEEAPQGPLIVFLTLAYSRFLFKSKKYTPSHFKTLWNPNLFKYI